MFALFCFPVYHRDKSMIDGVISSHESNETFIMSWLARACIYHIVHIPEIFLSFNQKFIRFMTFFNES